MRDPVLLADLPVALDAVAADVLRRAGWRGPPVDAVEIAHRLGTTIVADCGQAGRARQKRLGGRPSIFVRPEPRPERLQWAVAHEIGEHESLSVFQYLGCSADEVAAGMRESVANRLAARILMPTEWFAPDAQACDYDLLELKRRYGTASHESIAWRTLEAGPPALVTVFDQGRPTARRTNLPARPPRLQPVEWRCWEAIHAAARKHSLREGRLHVTGWPVHEPDWKREILRSEIDVEW